MLRQRTTLSIIIGLLGATLLLTPCAAAQTPATGLDVEPFLALERALVTGLHSKDRAALDRLLASDYALRGSPDVDRATWLDNAVTLCWGDRSDIDQLTVRRVGEAVVVSFVLTMYTDPRTCDEAVIRSLVTDLWEPQDGTWRLFVRHSGPVGGPDEVARQFEVVPPPPPRWEVKSELSFVSTGGNAETQTLGVGGELQFRPQLWETALRSSFVRSETQEVENARSFSLELRQSRRVSDRLELYGRASFLQDRFAGIDPRVAGDAGAAFVIVATPPHALKVDTGLGATRETRLTGDNFGFVTANLVAHYALALSETSELATESGFTADLETGENWRFNETLSFTATLTDLVSLKLSYTLKYLNLPVPGFETTDTIASAALVATFTRQ